MTRRVFALGIAALPASAAIDFDAEVTKGNISIRLIGEQGQPFLVGIRTPLKADYALTEVFYKVTVPGVTGELLLHKESLGPVAGNYGYAATNLNFDIPREAVQFIRVTLLNATGSLVEFR